MCIICLDLHCSALLGLAWGQNACCVRGQWLSLRCQWEFAVWMKYVSVFAVVSYNLYPPHLCNNLPSYKSSDLFMINPHISLNPWNPLIHGVILRFNEDFYCEIHGFHEQSSDLAVDLSKSSSRSESWFIHYFVWMSVWWSGRWLPLHNLWLPVPLSSQM